jgi:hypothetical protein
MTVDSRWHDDQKRIVVVRFGGKWTWEEGRINDEHLRALIESVEHSVDVILDMREVHTFPPNSVENAAQISEEPYKDKLGLCVVLSDRIFFELIAAIGQAIGGYHFDMDYAETMDDALVMIHRRYVC